MNTYTITSSSVLWECGKVGDFSIFPQNIEKKNLLNCIQKCSHKIFGFCLINKKLDIRRDCDATLDGQMFVANNVGNQTSFRRDCDFFICCLLCVP